MVIFNICFILFVSIVSLPYSTNSMALKDNPCDQPDTVHSTHENTTPTSWPYFNALHSFVSKLSSSKCNQNLVNKIKRHNPISIQIDPTNDLDDVENIQGDLESDPKPIQNIKFEDDLNQTLDVDPKDESNHIDSKNEINLIVNDQIDANQTINIPNSSKDDSNENQNDDSATTQVIEIDPIDDLTQIDLNIETNQNIQSNIQNQEIVTESNNHTNSEHDDDYDEEPDIVTQECYNNILSECGHQFMDSFSNEDDIQRKCENRADFNSCLEELQSNCTELAEVDVKPVDQEFRLKLVETIWASRVCMFLPRRD